MIVSKELCLRVIKSVYSHPERYEINDDVTILKPNNDVVSGTIQSIDDSSVTLISKKDKKKLVVLFNEIKDIADTDWLAGGDIRER